MKVYFEPLFGFILAKVDLPKSENQRSVSVLLIRKATSKLGLYNVLTVSLSRGITQNNIELESERQLRTGHRRQPVPMKCALYFITA